LRKTNVCPSAWNNSTPAGRIFMKFYILFSNICRENSSFIGTWPEKMLLYMKTVNFVMSGRLSFCIEQLDSNWTDFHEILYSKICRENSSFIRTWQEKMLLYMKTVNFVMSGRLSFCIEQLDSHWTDFHEILYFYILKSVEKIQVSLEPGTEKGYFTWRLLTSSCLAVCPSAWNNSTPTGRIFMKFYILFSKICPENSSFIRTWQEKRVLYLKTNVHLLSYLVHFFEE